MRSSTAQNIFGVRAFVLIFIAHEYFFYHSPFPDYVDFDDDMLLLAKHKSIHVPGEEPSGPGAGGEMIYLFLQMLNITSPLVCVGAC